MPTPRPFPVIKRMPAPDADMFAIFALGQVLATYLSFAEASEAVKAYTLDTSFTLDDLSDYIYGTPEGPSCSLCDALGHGYPGGGPCPLEDRGWADSEEERRYGSY